MSVIARKLENGTTKSQDTPSIWVLRKDPYVHGALDSLAKPKWLWGLGDAGSGKTCVASFLTRELRKAPAPDECVSVSNSRVENVLHGSRSQQLDTKVPLGSRSSVGTFYCNYKMKEDQDPDTIVGCPCCRLLVQLQSLDPNRCQELLLLVKHPMHLAASAAHRTDASQNIKPRRVFEAFSASLRVFVSSRDGKDGTLRYHAEDIGELQLRVHPEDKELQNYISERLHRISNRHENERTYKSALPTALTKDFKIGEVADKVFEKAVGNFLCAKLQITRLKDYMTIIEFQNHLDSCQAR